MSNKYKPEGMLMGTRSNHDAQTSLLTLQVAMIQKKILEARVLVCDSQHNLVVELNCCHGIIPRNETAIGVEDGSTRDIAIISRVNKPVCFIITGFGKDIDGNMTAYLSRKHVQKHCCQEYLSTLTPGDIIDARVTHMETFGCFVDIGCGITSLIPIDSISVSRISHPRDRFRNGQNIKAVVRNIEVTGRITLSHKELLGTWEENASRYKPGETVAGIVRSVESYGSFVELTPNLAGLAELKDNIRTGMHASVYIKSLIPEKMKIKLIIIDCFDAAYIPPDPVYHIEEGHISVWRYSPDISDRVVESGFDFEL